MLIHHYFSETAINIGYSCKLLTDDMDDIFIVDGESYEEVEKQIQKAKDDINQLLSSYNTPGRLRFYELCFVLLTLQNTFNSTSKL